MERSGRDPDEPVFRAANGNRFEISDRRSYNERLLCCRHWLDGCVFLSFSLIYEGRFFSRGFSRLFGGNALFIVDDRFKGRVFSRFFRGRTLFSVDDRIKRQVDKTFAMGELRNLPIVRLDAYRAGRVTDDQTEIDFPTPTVREVA